MPKTYLTLEDKQNALIQNREKKENFLIKSLLRERICRQLGYEYIQKKTNLSKPTIGKVVNYPELVTVAQLRAVCAAAEIPLYITAEMGFEQ